MTFRRITILGCGYVGSAVATELVRRGHSCRGTTTTAARHAALRAAGIEPVVMQLDDRPALALALADCDAVIMAVAPGRSGRTYRSVYLDGARQLVDALADHRSVRRVIYTGSTRVFGRCGGAWVDETTPPRPADDEGTILLDTEHTLLEGLAGRIPTTVLRLAGIYGPGRDPAERVARLAGTPCRAGSAWLNLVHRDDIVSAVVRLLDVAHHGVLHLSDDAPTTRRAYYDRLVAAAGLAPISWLPDDAGDTGKRVRNAQIKRVLGLQLAHPTH